MKNEAGYETFLIIELARTMKLIPTFLEYDFAWELGIELHNLFRTSKFNKSTESLYECVTKFIADLNENNLKLSFTEDKGKTWKKGTVVIIVGNTEPIVYIRDNKTKEIKKVIPNHIKETLLF